MAIDFPTPTQVGQVYTDPTSGNTYICVVLGPPAEWTGSSDNADLDLTYLRTDASNGPVSGNLGIGGTAAAPNIILGTGGTIAGPNTGTVNKYAIDASGTVSLGGSPTTPNTKLNADGTAAFTGNQVQVGLTQPSAANFSVTTAGNASGQALISLQSGQDISTDCQSGIAFGGSTGNHRSFIYGGHTSAGETVLLFQTDDFAGGAPNPLTKMLIEADGNVLIGGSLTNLTSPTPNILLLEDGTIIAKPQGESKVVALYHYITKSSDGTNPESNRISDTATAFTPPPVYIGNAAIQLSSDRRLQENIVDTELDALAAIQQLQVKDFTWNDPSDQSYNNRNARGVWTGLIAQELIEVLPFVVNAPRTEDGQVDNESESTWTLDQSQLCPVLVKALQEALTRIETLESEVATLKGA